MLNGELILSIPHSSFSIRTPLRRVVDSRLLVARLLTKNLSLVEGGLFGLFDFKRQFFAHHSEFCRGFDAEAHRSSRDFHHGDGDLVANENSLADFSRDDQHVGDLHLARRGGLAWPAYGPPHATNGSGAGRGLQAFGGDNPPIRRQRGL